MGWAYRKRWYNGWGEEGFQKIYENCETESMGILTLKK